MDWAISMKRDEPQISKRVETKIGINLSWVLGLFRLFIKGGANLHAEREREIIRAIDVIYRKSEALRKEMQSYGTL